MIIKWWTGTDALKLVMYPPNNNQFLKNCTVFFYRIFWKFAWKYFHHYAVSINLKHKLVKFGIPPEKIKIEAMHPEYFDIRKKPHKGFNVLYYRPYPNRGFFGPNQKLKDWLYGYDIIQAIKPKLPFVNWIEVRGDSDMRKIYPVVDLYIRPNRHDGMPRMVLECIRYKIPYYWELNVSEDKLIEFIKEIKNESYQDTAAG